ncbi:heme-binding protein [Paenibacillus sp. FSL H7-0357]|uniref:heme-binding protein n=2 Tax=unclassified Paenibacillus TaxID=185978 RepID=UPI00068E1189|nr:heme-binding protein [Paenibacillus sp. FSL H7-0357]
MNEIMENLLAEEDELQFSSFTSKDALQLGLLFIEIAEEMNMGGIGVKIEKNRHVLFTHLMDGTMPENSYWYDRKKNVVDRYFHSSKFAEEMFKASGSTFSESSLLDPGEFQAVGGSYPLRIQNAGVVGSITVCGLTGDLDHQICVEGIRKYLGKKGNN